MCLERIEKKHPGLSESHCGVAMDRVLQELRAASRLERLDEKLFIADGDFDDTPKWYAEVLHKALKKACKMVPRFELR